MAEEMGIGFLGIGFQPKWGLKDIPIMPKVWLPFKLSACREGRICILLES